MKDEVREKFEDFKKRFNVLSTTDINIYDLCRVHDDDFVDPYSRILEHPEKCISLRDIAKNFNNMYCEFKKDFDKVPKLNLASEVEYNYIYFSKEHEIDVLYLYLIDLKCVVCPDYMTRSRRRNINLMFVKNTKKNADGSESISYRAAFDSGRGPLGTGRYHVNANISEDIIKAYFELCEKHKEFLSQFERMSDQQIYGKNPSSFFVKITGNPFTGISLMNYSFGLEYFDDEYWISFSFTIGEKEPEVIYAVSSDNKDLLNKTIVILSAKLTDDKEIKEVIDDVLDNIYLPKSSLILKEDK